MLARIESLLTFTNELSTARRCWAITFSFRMIFPTNSSSTLVRHLWSGHWIKSTPSLITFCSIYSLQHSLQNQWPHPMSSAFYRHHHQPSETWFEKIKICHLINFAKGIRYEITKTKVFMDQTYQSWDRLKTNATIIGSFAF